ncbi:restriction endonuclease subunit S [Vibrio cholerae]
MSQLNYLEKLLDGVDVEWLPMKSLCSTITTGKLNANAMEDDGIYPFYTCNENPYKINSYAFDLEAIIISGNGSQVGHLNYYKGRFNAYQRTYVVGGFEEKIIVMYLFHYLNYTLKSYITQNSRKGSVPYITMPMLENFQVPIPCPDNPEKSLEIQAEIVRILDAFTAMTAELTAELNLRKKQYNYYRDQLLSFENGEVEWKSLEFLCKSISAGGDVPKNSAKGQTEPTSEYPYPIYANATDEKGLYGFTDNYKIDSDAVTISARGAKVGYHTVREAKFTPIIRLIVLVADKNLVTTKYLNYVLDMTPIGGTEGGIPQLTVPMVKKITVPIPFPNDPEKSLVEQARIVAILDKFDTLTTSQQEGLPREIELRQKQYEYYRDMLLSFPKPEEAAA